MLLPSFRFDDAQAKLEVVRLLEKRPVALDQEDIPALQGLLRDPEVDPAPIATACWELLRIEGLIPGADEAGARLLEESAFLHTLLEETSVAHLPAERALTALRRWLLLSGSAETFPRAVAALARQAARNGGAWPFDEEEAARLAGPMREAYLAPRPFAPGRENPARSISRQYESWPYPSWERVTRVPGDTLAGRIAALGPDAPRLPANAEILVAGCGTGYEAALLSHRAPDARITAVDLSSASLAYARARHAELGTRNVTFEQRDLREATAVADQFDYISSSGVIHHLPDPESDWASLVHALKPGGVMGIMVYSKIARMRIKAAQYRIPDLMGRPVDDDLLRQARARLIAQDHPVAHSTDFATLGGVHDLLFNTHEDPFDIPRIRDGIDRLGLRFLGFHLPDAERRERYRREHPDDPWFRDYSGWAATELREPSLFAAMYRFWCMKPAG